jgi:transposase-like protein
MRRIAPSERVREEVGRLFAGGADREANLASELMKLGMRLLVQQGLEQEQADFIGRDRYARGDRNGWRNGYEPSRIRTGEGNVAVQVPQVRGASEPFHPKLLAFLAGNSEVLERLVVEMYARGLSTRDVEDCFRDSTGELVISKTAVSEITDRLWEDFQAFQTRSLADVDVEYLFVDAIYESLRRYGAKEGVLAAWCITTQGRKVLLHLAVGNKESEECWTEFFHSMISRGLRAPVTITADGAPGLRNAINACFAKSLRIRCWFHKMGNIRAKLPDDAAEEFIAHCRAVRDAATPAQARSLVAEIVERYEREFPAAVACLLDDLEASLAHLRVPARHRRNVRTTNLAERSFEEERRRTKVIPRLLDERSAMKLVFAVLIRCSERWQRVAINDIERGQLRALRRELGLEPPPGGRGEEGSDVELRRTVA